MGGGHRSCLLVLTVFLVGNLRGSGKKGRKAARALQKRHLEGRPCSGEEEIYKLRSSPVFLRESPVILRTFEMRNTRENNRKMKYGSWIPIGGRENTLC